MIKTLIPVAVLIALTSSTSTLCAQTPKTLSVKYTNGTSARVQVLGISGEKATLKVLIFGGSMTIKKKLSDLEPESGYRVEVEAAQPATFEAHFGFARKAASLKLLGPAGSQARSAIAAVAGKADEKEKTMSIRAWGADTIESWLRDALARSDRRDAEHFLKLLSTRLSDQRSEAQLDVLAGSVAALKQKERDMRRAKRQAKLDARARASIDRKLKSIRDRAKVGDKYYRQAVAKARQTTASANLAEKAIVHYRKAYRSLESLQKKEKDDEYLANEAASIAGDLKSNAIQSALHAANMLCVRSDYKGAMGWTTKILDIDPTNSEAKQLVRTIQIAGAADSSWRWGWGRHGQRPMPRRQN